MVCHMVVLTFVFPWTFCTVCRYFSQQFILYYHLADIFLNVSGFVQDSSFHSPLTRPYPPFFLLVYSFIRLGVEISMHGLDLPKTT